MSAGRRGQIENAVVWWLAPMAVCLFTAQLIAGSAGQFVISYPLSSSVSQPQDAPQETTVTHGDVFELKAPPEVSAPLLWQYSLDEGMSFVDLVAAQHLTIPRAEAWMDHALFRAVLLANPHHIITPPHRLRVALAPHH